MASFDPSPARIAARAVPSNFRLAGRRALPAMRASARLAASLPTSLPARGARESGGVRKAAAAFDPSSPPGKPKLNESFSAD